MANETASPLPSPMKWSEVETLLNIVILCNKCGPKANNISVAARQILYELNESLPPAPEGETI